MKGQGRWWRAYDDALNNPKLQKLSGNLFKSWFNLCCLSSKHDGRLPPLAEVAFALRITEPQAKKICDELFEMELIDTDEVGMRMHEWDVHQYKSDVSTDRVKRFRKRHLKQDETVSETPPDTEQSRAEEETEQTVRADARAAEVLSFTGQVIRLTAKDFSQWERAYPRLDLLAELTARDAWLASDSANDDDRRRWFISTSKYLANRNMEARARGADASDEAIYRGVQ